MTTEASTFPLYFASTVANLIAFTTGSALSWTSPVLPKLNGKVDPDYNPLPRPTTLLEESWIGALLPLGALCGPIFAGIIADKLGRKKTLIILACPFLLAFIIMAFAKMVALFLFARLISGLAVGSVFTTLPMYLVEISEDHNRGTLSCLMATFVSGGILFTYIVGPLVTVQVFCLLNCVPLLVYVFVFAIWNPETPHFLALVEDPKNMRRSLLKLRDKSLQDIEREMFDISQTVQELSRNKGGVQDLFTVQVLRKALFISVGLMALQQFAGIAAVTAYMQTIFDVTGSSISPEVSAVIIGTIQVMVTGLTSSLVDRLGRRVLLLVSSLGSGFSLLTLGIYFFLQDNNVEVGSIFWLPVTSLIVFTLTFQLGLGPLPWTVMAELFPAHIKSAASTATTVVCFLGNFAIMLCFPYLSVGLGMAQTFWVFAVVCVVTAGYVFWVLPETKGKSIQEIQDLLKRH